MPPAVPAMTLLANWVSQEAAEILLREIVRQEQVGQQQERLAQAWRQEPAAAVQRLAVFVRELQRA